MNALDLLIITVLLIEAQRGASVGIVRSFFALSGFWIGVVIGALVSPLFMRFGDGAVGRIIIALVVIVSFALLVGSLGKTAGIHLRRFTTRLRLRKVDAVLGSAFSAVVTLFIIWLFASLLSGMPFNGLNRQIQTSDILHAVDETLPPAPTVLERISRLINPHGFPDVFVGREPTPAQPVDPANAADIAEALENTKGSVVRIEGIGCGGLVSGSGFIADQDYVITNAHVVAGIRSPAVDDGNGRHRATTVYFDPDLDLAVLRVRGLSGTPLQLSQDFVARSTKAVVIGYPEGGPLTAVPAGVLRDFSAIGRNIYNTKITERRIYELISSIREGNSGGPVVTPDGTVIGVIFAKSHINDNIGYAIVSSDVSPALATAKVTDEVTTGRCAP